MTLEDLQKRHKEIEDAIVTTNGQLHMLYGHRAENNFHLQAMQKKLEESESNGQDCSDTAQ